MTERYRVRDPFTGETGNEYPVLGGIEADALLGDAFAVWESRRETGIEERAGWAGRIAEGLRKAADDLAELIVREIGKPHGQAVGEVRLSASIFEYYAENAARFLADEVIEGVNARIRKCPLGPLLGVMPWNFPVYQSARFVAPNLVLGNPVLLKPAPQCPTSTLAFEAIVAAAIGDGRWFQSAFLDHAGVARLIADRRVRGVSLTGSERAGRAVAELAGRHLKPVVLELGGSDPFLVLGGDLRTAAKDAAVARLFNAGQMCTSAKRIIVAEPFYDEFLEYFLEEIGSVQPGDPRHPATSLGPLASVAAAALLEDQLRAAVAAGARLMGASTTVRSGALFLPAVLTDIEASNPAANVEFFGPVAQVYRATGEGEAVRLANATDFGLGAYVYSGDPEQARRVADELECGMVFLNTVSGADRPELPFGGVKASGYGRELGRAGIEQFMNRKLIRG